jgi:PTH1 family peptidyl-tRNA hydrolase
LTADVLGARAGVQFRVGKFRAATAEGRVAGFGVIIVKPLTFMNDSGIAVAGVSGYHRLDPEHIVAVHDELDLPFGAIRLKRGGGDNGHNGLRSTSSALGTKDYVRVRMGIGRPPGRQDPADYVLKPFSTTERKELPVWCEEGADAVELVLRLGLEGAQNRVH